MTMIASFHSPEPYLAARIQDHQKGGVSLLESVPRGQKTCLQWWALAPDIADRTSDANRDRRAGEYWPLMMKNVFFHTLQS